MAAWSLAQQEPLGGRRSPRKEPLCATTLAAFAAPLAFASPGSPEGQAMGDTRNARWAKDPDSVGRAMLLKLGWKQGSALGAVGREGAVDPIKVKRNKDSAGLGFDASRDAPEGHTDAFADVLSSLKRDFPVEEAAEASKEAAAAPTAKRRRRYKKFKDAKDVSRYSPEDLRAILGGKAAES